MFSIQVMESESTMPPIAAPTPQSLYQDFEIKYKDWSQSSFHCLSELREDREISMKMTNEIINGYESIQEVCLNIQNLEPDHANLFPYLTSQMEGVNILWKICLLKFAFKGRSVEELEADVRNYFRHENDGKELPALKTKNADKQMVATKIDQQEQECHARSEEEQGNKSFNEEDQGKCFPKLPSISEIEIENVSNDAGKVKMKEPSINETFSNSSFYHATNGDDFGKVEPGDTNFSGLDKSFDNNPTRPDVDLVLVKEDSKEDGTLSIITDAEDDEEAATKKAAPALVAKKAAAEEERFPDEESSGEKEEKERVDVELAPQEKEEKEARVHSGLCVVASQERKAVDVASQGEEKEEVDANVDATRLDKALEVFNDEENHPVEEKQAKSDELFENDDQSNEDDDHTNDDEQSDDHSDENDEGNGNDYDQVKTKELFDSIAIFLFFPNYKYRKKRWPGKLEL